MLHGDAAKAGVNAVVDNRGTIATLGATGFCLIPAVGPDALAAQAAAAAVRVQERGCSNVASSVADVTMTSATFVLVATPLGLPGDDIGPAGARLAMAGSSCGQSAGLASRVAAYHTLARSHADA